MIRKHQIGFHCVCLAALVSSCCLTSVSVGQGLFGYAGGGADSDTLFAVTSTPSATFIGNDPASGIVAETEFVNGVIYGADTNENTNLHSISPTTGMVTNTLTMNFPAGGDVITSMESVNGILYAGLTTEGGGDTALAAINTTTGDVTVVGGFSGIGTPLGGLAWDGSKLYGVTAGGSNADLYSFDLGTGAATFETSVNAVTGAPIGLTALEFGTDGVLYSIANRDSGIADELLTIDPTTGIFTSLGSTGVQMNSLTAVPEPSSGLVLLIGCLFVGIGRRSLG